jgi:hypothetical protein
MNTQSCHFCGQSVTRRGKAKPIRYCNTRCKAEWQKTQRPVTVEWLKQKYEVEKLDCTQIAKRVNRDSKSVWNWLKASGIETRKRGATGNWKLVKKPAWKGKRLSDAHRKLISDAAKRNGRCPALINGVHWLKHYPERKVAAWQGGITPERQAFYAAPEWKLAAKAVWRRDGSKCQRCGLGRGNGVPLDIHHIVGFACRELRAELTNLILLCEPCHYWVHSNENKNREHIKSKVG